MRALLDTQVAPLVSCPSRALRRTGVPALPTLDCRNFQPIGLSDVVRPTSLCWTGVNCFLSPSGGVLLASQEDTLYGQMLHPPRSSEIDHHYYRCKLSCREPLSPALLFCGTHCGLGSPAPSMLRLLREGHLPSCSDCRTKHPFPPIQVTSPLLVEFTSSPAMLRCFFERKPVSSDVLKCLTLPTLVALLVDCAPPIEPRVSSWRACPHKRVDWVLAFSFIRWTSRPCPVSENGEIFALCL